MRREAKSKEKAAKAAKRPRSPERIRQTAYRSSQLELLIDTDVGRLAKPAQVPIDDGDAPPRPVCAKVLRRDLCGGRGAPRLLNVDDGGPRLFPTPGWPENPTYASQMSPTEGLREVSSGMVTSFDQPGNVLYCRIVHTDKYRIRAHASFDASEARRSKRRRGRPIRLPPLPSFRNGPDDAGWEPDIVVRETRR